MLEFDYSRELYRYICPFTQFFLFTFFFVPETKAKTVDIIYAEITVGQVWRKHPQKDNRSSQINDVGSTVDYETLA